MVLYIIYIYIYNLFSFLVFVMSNSIHNNRNRHNIPKGTKSRFRREPKNKISRANSREEASKRRRR